MSQNDRAVVVATRVTQQQKRMLSWYAAARGMSVSDLLRAAVDRLLEDASSLLAGAPIRTVQDNGQVNNPEETANHA